jgi:hypothetical protein
MMTLGIAGYMVWVARAAICSNCLEMASVVGLHSTVYDSKPAVSSEESRKMLSRLSIEYFLDIYVVFVPEYQGLCSAQPDDQVTGMASFAFTHRLGLNGLYIFTTNP